MHKRKHASPLPVPKSGSNYSSPETALHRPLYPLADLFDRSVGYIIDIVVFVLPVGLILMAVNPNIFVSLDLRWVTTLYFLGFLLYFWMFTWLNHGQTVGAMIMRLRVCPLAVVTITVKSPSPPPALTKKQAFLHSLGKIPYVVGFDLLIGWVVAKKFSFCQTPARTFQIWADTVVVKEEPAEKPKMIELQQRF